MERSPPNVVSYKTTKPHFSEVGRSERWDYTSEVETLNEIVILIWRRGACPDDGRSCLSLKSKHSEEILPNFWDGRRREWIRRWEKNTLASISPAPGRERKRRSVSPERGGPPSSVPQGRIEPSQGELGGVCSGKPEQEIASLHWQPSERAAGLPGTTSVIRQRPEVSPSPTRYHGNLLVLRHTPRGKGKCLKITATKIPSGLPEWGLECESEQLWG